MIAGVAAVAVLVAAGGVWRLWQQDYFWRNPLADATVERLTDFEGEEVDAAISPDGKFTVFLSDRDGPINAWASQIGSGEFVNISKGHSIGYNGTIRYTGFSGDGAQVWFQQSRGQRGLNSLWMAPALGGTPRPFVDPGMNPTWSPDGKSLAYHTNDARRSHLHRGPERQQSQTDIRGTAGGSLPLSDVVARWSLHLFRERYSPDGGNGYLARPRVPE